HVVGVVAIDALPEELGATVRALDRMREEALERREHATLIVGSETADVLHRVQVGVVHVVGVEEEEELAVRTVGEPRERTLELEAVLEDVEALVEAARAVHVAAAREGDGRV